MGRKMPRSYPFLNSRRCSWWIYIIGVVSGCFLSHLFCREVDLCQFRKYETFGLKDRDVFHRTQNSTNGKILCWVVTTPNSTFKAKVVKYTWGRRCDKLLFMSSKEDATLPAIGLPVAEESRSQLWKKATLTLRYIYEHHLADYDWFFKADDDTYAVMENMRHLLATLNSSEPLFVGHQFPMGNDTFLSGGAGYVLTRESIRRLVEQGLDLNLCPTHYHGAQDDVTITMCLIKLGAIIPNTSDQWGHHRFLSCSVEQFYGGKVGPINCRNRTVPLNCLSSEPITFHYTSGFNMLMYDYLIYKFKFADWVH